MGFYATDEYKGYSNEELVSKLESENYHIEISSEAYPCGSFAREVGYPYER